MSDPSNPYASASEEPDWPESATASALVQKKAFRWQLLPSLFCIAAIAFCCLLIWLLILTMRDVYSRWDNYTVPNAHILALLTTAGIVLTAAFAFAFAARRWLTLRHFTAVAGSIAGTALLALVIPDEYFLLDFWQSITLRLGWDT